MLSDQGNGKEKCGSEEIMKTVDKVRSTALIKGRHFAKAPLIPTHYVFDREGAV